MFNSPGRPDKTFTIAVVAAAVIGVAEFIAVGWHYARQPAAPQTAATPPVAIAPATPPPVAAATATAAPIPTATAAGEPNNAVLSVAEELLKDVSLMRERGDTNTALARLQQATESDPQNARLLAEMAMIYESMQLFDRSNQTWQKIQEIGPSAGPLYELADMKLKEGVPAANGSAAAAGPGFAGVSPLDAGTIRSSQDGIPDGSTFGITEATLTENPDAEAESNLTLRVAVKMRPDSIVDHTKVKIQVYFYDMVDNNNMALTDAEVSYEWITPDHDWKKTNPEILSVGYLRLKGGALSTEAALTEAAAAVTPPIGNRKASIKPPSASSANRKYAGYQVRVYYLDQLQDVRAEPTKLLNLFPPPLTLSPQ